MVKEILQLGFYGFNIAAADFFVNGREAVGALKRAAALGFIVDNAVFKSDKRATFRFLVIRHWVVYKRQLVNIRETALSGKAIFADNSPDAGQIRALRHDIL